MLVKVLKIAINQFKNVCLGSKFTVQILEKLPANGYQNCAVNSEMLKYRLHFQDHWIKTIRTIYPYSLNQRTKLMCANKPICKSFPSFSKYGERYSDTIKRPVDNKNNLHVSLLTP